MEVAVVAQPQMDRRAVQLSVVGGLGGADSGHRGFTVPGSGLRCKGSGFWFPRR